MVPLTIPSNQTHGPLPTCLLQHQGPASPSQHTNPHQPSRSPLAQVGHQVHEAHQQEATNTKHHEQEKQQDGGHRLHCMVAQMPLGEAHVYQLPVEVIEGRLGSPQPGTCLLWAGAGPPLGDTMAPVEKALPRSATSLRGSGPHPGVIILNDFPIGQDPHHPPGAVGAYWAAPVIHGQGRG